MQRKPAPRRQRPGQFVDDFTPPKPRFSWWRLLGRVGATIVAFFILEMIFGFNLVTVLLAPIVGLVLYELWYLMFETTA